MDKRFTYLVEKYLDHKLNEPEKREFEKFLKDPACADYLKKAEITEKLKEREYRKMQEKAGEKVAAAETKEYGQSEADDFQEEIPEDGLEYGGNEDSEIAEAEQRMHQEILKRGKKILFIISGSAVGAGLMWLVFFFSPHTGKSPQELFKQYYKPYEYTDFSSLKGNTPSYNNAIVLYTGGVYAESARLCREYLSTETREPEVHFLYGLNLMEMDSLQSAIKQFKAVTNFPVPKDGSLYAPAHWYSGLCYLALGKVDSALIDLGLINGIDNLFTREIDVEGLYKSLEMQLSGKKSF